MEYLIAAAVIGGFAYFVYSRVRKARAERPSGGSGGGSPRDPDIREDLR